jgi:hypothetical protein
VPLPWPGCGEHVGDRQVAVGDAIEEVAHVAGHPHAAVQIHHLLVQPLPVGRAGVDLLDGPAGQPAPVDSDASLIALQDDLVASTDQIDRVAAGKSQRAIETHEDRVHARQCLGPAR